MARDGASQGTKASGHQPGVVPITRHVHFAPSHMPPTSAVYTNRAPETEPPQQNESDDISAATCMLPAEGAKPNAVKGTHYFQAMPLAPWCALPVKRVPRTLFSLPLIP